MSILAKMLGKEEYPKFETAVLANGEQTKVVVSMTLSPDHVELDSPGYLENKIKKSVRAFESLGTVIKKNSERAINVTMSIKGRFNSVNDIATLAMMGKTICQIAEDRLSEVRVLNNINDDCEPWFVDDEKETC